MLKKEGLEDWISEAKKDNKDLFSELDVFLSALDRFFTIENLTTSDKDLSNKNFFNELVTVRDAILHVLGILEVIIPESRKNAYWFQKFAETKFMSEHKRDALREELYKQDTPEKGLYLLYDTFINLKGVITDLIRSRTISYMGFCNIGHLINKEIRENIFFNPFKRNVTPEHDVINNSEISEIVKAIGDRELKKHLSLIYLYLFRFLRFMGFIDISTQRLVSLNSSLIILILMRAEIKVFIGYVEKSIEKIQEPELVTLLKSLRYQFSMETKRVYLQELKDIHRKKMSSQFRGKIENGHGILKNLTEQSIVLLSQYFKPEIKGEDIFESFVTKVEQSLRLREDIFVLHEFISLFESRVESLKERTKFFVSLKNYMLYFESFTFRLLRHDDYEEFLQFFNEINSVNNKAVCGPEFDKIFDRIMHFKIYLETTLRHINNRSEISGKELDMERVKSLIDQYI
jgi:archaeosine-15-forming tRNA-guanine transglycosylase